MISNGVLVCLVLFCYMVVDDDFVSFFFFFSDVCENQK